MKDAWEILGINPTENKREVKKAYAKMVAKYHPEDYPEEFQKVQEAYESILQSFDRDYQKTSNFTSDLQEGFHKVDSEYGDFNLNKKDEFEEASSDQENDIISDQKNQEFFDSLDLSWSFHDEPQHKEKEKIGDIYESIEVHMDEAHKENKPKNDVKNSDVYVYDEAHIDEPHKENKPKPKKDVEDCDVYVYDEAHMDEPLKENKQNYEEELVQYLYEHFLERIKFSCKLDIMKKLVLNQTFFEHMQYEDFYHKITKLVQKNYHRYDTLTVSFLFDAFAYIQENLKYSDHDEYSITNFIHIKKVNHQAKMKRKEKMRNGGAVIVFICLFLVIFFIQGIRKEKKDNEEKVQQQIQEIRQKDVQDTVKMVENNEVILNEYMQETYGYAYSCNITTPSTNATIVLFRCEGGQEEATPKTGNAYLGENKEISSVHVIGEVETESE